MIKKITIQKMDQYWYDTKCIVEYENDVKVFKGSQWEILNQQLYFYNEEGSTGTGKRRGSLLFSCSLQGVEFYYNKEAIKEEVAKPHSI